MHSGAVEAHAKTQRQNAGVSSDHESDENFGLGD